MSSSAERAAILVPVKAFRRAKGRLGRSLDGDERAALARNMATHVVQAQGSTHVSIACDDDEVAAWAESVGADTIWCPDTDLNGAVARGFEQLRADGWHEVVVAHSDIPRAGSLRYLFGWPGVTIVPDRHRRGTNVLVAPTDVDFRFSYGPDSYRRHVAEAVRHGRGLRLVHDAELGWDVDHPDDLGPLTDELMTIGAAPGEATDPA